MESETQKSKKKFYKRWWFWLLIVIVLFYILGSNNVSNTVDTSSLPSTTQPALPQAQTSLSKDEAQSDLDNIIALAKKGNLVTSYEFSDTATVVYIGPAWYTQTVQFKRDFMAKIAVDKKAITGYQHFEIRDAYSNEKVGEVTAFNGSFEVYK